MNKSLILFSCVMFVACLMENAPQLLIGKVNKQPHITSFQAID